MFGFQGRSLSKTTKLRYITIILDESQPNFLVLTESILMKSIHHRRFLQQYVPSPIRLLVEFDVHIPSGSYNDCCYVYDNEPRNAQIVQRISKTTIVATP